MRGRPPRPRHLAAPVIVDMLLAEALTVEEIGARLTHLKPVGDVRLPRTLRPFELARIEEMYL